MKALAGIIGFLLGGACAVALLLFNPFYPKSDAGVYDTADVIYHDYAASESGGMSLTPEKVLRLSVVLGEDTDFAAEGIRNVSTMIAVMRDRDRNAAALATKLTAIAQDSNLLRGDVGVDSYWNVFWPNQGSAFLVGRENHWPVLREDLIRVILGESERSIIGSYSVTVRDEGQRVRGVLGSSGIFTGATGLFQEEMLVDPESDSAAEGTLRMQINKE